MIGLCYACLSVVQPALQASMSFSFIAGNCGPTNEFLALNPCPAASSEELVWLRVIGVHPERLQQSRPQDEAGVTGCFDTVLDTIQCM